MRWKNECKKRGEEEGGGGGGGGGKAKQEEEQKKPRVTWLGLGEEWGVVRDVRRMIYKMLTPLERVTVESAYGVDRSV